MVNDNSKRKKNRQKLYRYTESHLPGIVEQQPVACSQQGHKIAS